MNAPRNSPPDGLAVEPKLIRALGHPLRQRILLAMEDGVASPVELSAKLGEPLSNVSYHIKVLSSCDAIELVKTQQVRGAVEHFYKAKARAHLRDEDWTGLPPTMRRSLLEKTVGEIWANVGDAVEAGGLEDPRTHVSWTNLDLDEQGQAEMVEHVNAALDQALAIRAAAAERLEKGADATTEPELTQFVLMHFHRAPDASD